MDRYERARIQIREIREAAVILSQQESAALEQTEAQRAEEFRKNEEAQRVTAENALKVWEVLKGGAPEILGEINVELLEGKGRVYPWKNSHLIRYEDRLVDGSSGDSGPDYYAGNTSRTRFFLSMLTTMISVPSLGDLYIGILKNKQVDYNIDINSHPKDETKNPISGLFATPPTKEQLREGLLLTVFSPELEESSLPEFLKASLRPEETLSDIEERAVSMTVKLIEKGLKNV